MQVDRQVPTGPRRGGASRGKARARGRTDRDGDLKMDTAVKGRSRIGKTSAPSGSASTRNRDAIGTRAPKANLLSAAGQRALSRAVAGKDVSMKETRSGSSSSLVELKVTGWDKSKAATTSDDGGLTTLIKWLEKKASLRLGSGRRDVRIKKSKAVDNILFLSVAEQDAPGLLRLNGFAWAGANIVVERVGGPAQTPTAPSNTDKIKAMLRAVLERRYNPDSKFLDLSLLGQDEELQAQNIFDKKSTTNKFFPAMMSVLSKVFDTAAERDAAIQSVSLANNDLQDLQAVSTLSETLPKLQNLDLSNNKFEDLSTLGVWRRRFRDLQHLILSGNPLEQKSPNYATEIMSWYRNLRMLNNIQVRTEEEIAQNSKNPPLPFPIRSALFQDEGGIAEKFVCNFFAGMDQNRPALAAIYYDEHSEFSFALNTGAPRDPAATEKTEKQEWDRYIKGSRNLKKISQLPARMNRSFKGTKAITDALVGMPASKHPDILSEAHKWLVEAHIQPGIPDVTGQNPNGIDGFFITVHTEFEEVDGPAGQHKKKRSADHVFMIAPGGGPEGIRIHTHMLTIRAYGGFQAFQPSNQSEEHGPPTPPSGAAAPIDAVPELPAGLTIPMAEQMVAELTKQTNMTVQYSKLCLEQTSWDFQGALVAFTNAKATLPQEAFNQV